MNLNAQTSAFNPTAHPILNRQIVFQILVIVSSLFSFASSASAGPEVVRRI